ncbi:MAG: type VI secretion system-associated protein TagF [Alphaproteobacteria bacterium]|nr:type VI secretion system-associated protein TagF [Alphaproteobacteria bacterium]
MPSNPVIATTIGFFGKLPATGDFVVRGFERPVVSALTVWTDQLVSHLRRGAGEDWAAVFDRLQPIAWVAGEGVCGPGVFAGLMRPSMDRVGRRYPLIVGVALRPGRRVVPIAAAAQGWFDYVTGLIGDTWSPGLSVETLTAALVEAPPFPDTGEDGGAIAEPIAAGGWHVRWAGRPRAQDLSAEMFDAAAAAALGRHSLFWVGPMVGGADVLIVPGLASADQLLALAL